MILCVFSVYDAAADAFLPPFCERSRGSALRAFIGAASDEKHAFRRNPTDYVLYHVANFDDADGRMSPVVPAFNMGRACDLLAVEKPN